MFELIILIVLLLAIFKDQILKKITKVQFEKKLVWITGASSGIGEELAKQFSQAGATLILTSRSVDQLDRVRSLCKNSQNHMIFPLDLSKPVEVLQKTKEFVAELEKQGKKIDIVIENAGASQRSFCVDTDYDTHEYMTNLNYNGPVAHAKGYLEHMIKNKSGQIVVMSSVAGKITGGLRTSYAGSKHAIAGFFDAVRSEVAEHNIQVTQLFPGYIRTNISKNAMTGQKGQTFGKTDSNISEGMAVEDFGKEALFSIHQKEIERVISDTRKHHYAIYIRHLFPGLLAKSLRKHVKSQIEAQKKAK